MSFFKILFCRINHKTGNPTRGVAAVCVERQHLDELVVGAGGQQLTAVAPGHAVDGALVVFVPPEANRRLLDGAAAGGRRRGHGMRDTEQVQVYPEVSLGCRLIGPCERLPPGGRCVRVGAHSQGFGVGAHGVERPRGMEGHGAHGLRVLQLVHPHILGFGLPRLDGGQRNQLLYTRMNKKKNLTPNNNVL